MASFLASHDPSFCVECGTLLPIVGTQRTVVCPRCFAKRSAADFEDIRFESHSRPFAFQKPKFNTRVAERKAVDGVQIDEECPKCGKREMTFKTAQLRSADEGQTIFYTCKCGHTFSLNS